MNSSRPNPQTQDLSQAATPGLLRRLAAIFYDSLLVAASLFVASIVPLLLNGGTPITEPWWARLLMQLYLLLVIYIYFAWHWRRGGQTLGMRAWRLRLLRTDGTAATWSDCAKRFFAAILALAPAGIGLVWCLFDAEKQAWHDRLSGTRLVLTAQKSAS